MTQAQYEIGRVSEQCALSGEPLKPGDPFVAALFEAAEGERLERRDYSPRAWASLGRPARLLAHWRGIVPSPDKDRRPLIDAGALMGLFEQLGESHEARQVAFRYVLALILMRKRVLVPAGSVAARGDAPGELLVRQRGAAPEEPPIHVVDPAMDEEMVGEITEQLRVLLRLEA